MPRQIGLCSAAFSSVALAICSPAAAQEAPTPPSVISPLKSEQDPNGVNLTTGKKSMDMPVVLSTPADPRLTFDRVQNSAPYVSGTIAACSGDSCGNRTSSWSAHLGGQTSKSFQCKFDDVCHSVTWEGSVFNFYTHDVRESVTGADYNFNLEEVNFQSPNGTTLQYYASSVAYPDGETISYTYDLGYLPGDQFNRTFYRPNKISSNTGYYITVSYQYTGTDVGQTGWGSPAEAALYSPTGTLIRRIVYSGSGITDYGNSATNVGGRTFTATAISNALGLDLEAVTASLSLPGEAAPEIETSAATGQSLIGSVNRDGVAWSYGYANARFLSVGDGFTAYDSVTVSGPNGYQVTYATEPTSYFGLGYTTPQRNVIKSSTDILNRITTFTHDPTRGDLLVGITFPEGNSVELGYDDCGNVVSKKTFEKPSAGSAFLHESAVYGNAAGCPDVNSFRPMTYTDALGLVTNYAYNSGGQMIKQLDPADQSGNQRLALITYAPSVAGISRKTLVQVCKSSSSTIDTAACSGTALSHTEYTYLGDTNLPLTATQKDEATGETRTTAYAYDAAGRPVKVDGPLTGTDDAKYVQYDTFGRKVWEVAERDSSNGLRLAKKYTYRDSDDKVTSVQTGTVSCASACDTASLSLTLLQQTDTTYDARRNPIRDKTYKGATTYSVTDRSFLDRGLAECSTVRMNLAAPPSATDHGACSLGTEGTQGPDRITRNLYDNAGQLLKVQKAYGVAGLQQDYVTYTYTGNGKQQTVTDANGNKAQYTYDGFDRLIKWAFPSKTTAGSVSTTDYEQYAYDDAGNRTCLRKRDGSKLTYAFDALNRMTSKVVAAASGGSCP